MTNTRKRVTHKFGDELAECDAEIECELGDEAIIDGRYRITGFFVEKEPIKVNLGSARAGMKIPQTHFKVRLCLCPWVACGMTLETCGNIYKIGEIGPSFEGYLHLPLTHCGACT